MPRLAVGGAACALLQLALPSCAALTGDTSTVCAPRNGAGLVGTWAVAGYNDRATVKVAGRASDRREHDTTSADQRALMDTTQQVRPARGFVVYDEAGYVHGQVVYGPSAAGRHAWPTATREQVLEVLTNQTSFYGTFEVDTAGRRVLL